MRSKKAFLNLFTNILREGISVICGFILPSFLISSFGTEVFGLTESIKGFLSFIVLLEAGFGPVVKVALYKALAHKNFEDIKRILKTSEKFFRRIAFVFLAYIIGLALLYPVISGSNFGYIFTAILVVIMSISLFAEYFFGMTYRLFLQADQKTYISNIIQVTTQLLNLAAVIIAIKCGASIIIVEMIIGIIYLLRPALQNVYIKRKYDISLSNVKADYKIKQKWDALTHHIAFMIHSRTDVVVLTVLASLKDVAIYSVYALVLNGIKSIVNIVAESFSAAFGDMIAKKEEDVLRRKFGAYETMFMTISAVVYSCTLALIVPFISVYTANISDTDYIQPLFGALLTISVYLLTIRQPYNELVKAAGHFKQTRRGSVIEALVNIVLSVILVWKFGLIGVAIGTLVATLIRATEFIWYTNKNILKRSVLGSVKKILVLAIETIIAVLVANYLPKIEIGSYLTWAIYAAEIFVITAAIVLPVNYLLFKNDFKELKRVLKRIASSKKLST